MKDVDVFYRSVVLGDRNNNEYTESYVKPTFFLLKLRNNSIWKVIRFFIMCLDMFWDCFFKVDGFYFALLVAEVIPSLLAACEVFEDF